MALYAQDVFGYVSDELIAEIARRLGPEHPAGHRDAGVLLDDSPQARRQISRAGLHERFLHAARRRTSFTNSSRRNWRSATRKSRADGVFSLEEVECIGACTGAPAMQVNYDFYENLTPSRTNQLLDQLDKERTPPVSAPITGSVHERHPAEVPVISRLFGVPDSHKLDVYLRNDGYKGLERALKELTPEQVVDEVKKSNLRGRGGAGFSTGMKWSFVPKESAKPKYILCNADESEPGTCKDRPLMEMAPHQLIEGIVIAGRAVGAHHGYIYIRGEYRYVLDIVDAAIEEAYAARLSRQEYSRQRLRLRPGHAHRRGRLRVRRGIGADGIARRQARLPAHPAAVSRRGGPVRLADRHQQRRNAFRGAGNSAARRRMVCRPGFGEKRRHAAVLHLGPRQSAGHLRIADGLQPEANDRRRRRRHRGRQEAEGRDSRRQFLSAA